MNKLLEIQRELPKIGKDANNPYFKSGYLTLEKLLDVMLPKLNEKGLLLVQYPSVTEEGVAVLFTEIYDGDSIVHSSAMSLALKSQDPQAQGSAITYARRYALMAIFVIVPAETDDDGNAATPISPEKGMNKTQWAALGKLLDEKGISDRDDKIRLIQTLSEGKPLNTSAYNRLEKEITEAAPDTLQNILMENL